MAARKINSVGIVVKPGHAEALATAGEVTAWLATHDIAQAGEPVSAMAEADDHTLAAADLIVVLGGDGTMIATARMIETENAIVA